MTSKEQYFRIQQMRRDSMINSLHKQFSSSNGSASGAGGVPTPIDSGNVKSVNGVFPDTNGNVRVPTRIIGQTKPIYYSSQILGDEWFDQTTSKSYVLCKDASDQYVWVQSNSVIDVSDISKIEEVDDDCEYDELLTSYKQLQIAFNKLVEKFKPSSMGE